MSTVTLKHGKEGRYRPVRRHAIELSPLQWRTCPARATNELVAPKETSDSTTDEFRRLTNFMIVQIKPNSQHKHTKHTELFSKDQDTESEVIRRKLQKHHQTLKLSSDSSPNAYCRRIVFGHPFTAP